MTPFDLPEPAQKPWALYVYLCGDNRLLAPHTRAQVDAIRSRGGSDALHVAVQWDLPEGAKRAVAGTASTPWAEEDLGRRNTGDPDELTAFLGWAIERCPATHVALVLSGTGLLDARASIGQPDVDRSRMFTVLDDTTERDALELASLRGALSKALVASPRQTIDLVAFDINELQFLEVAYELDGLVEVMVAPQTPVPPEGWDFDAVLGAMTGTLAGGVLSARDLGRLLVDLSGRGYQRRTVETVSVSALDLARLSDVANAFDTMSLAMMYSVGEELVWQARERVFRGLRRQDGPGDGVTLARKIENEWLYDLVGMLSRFEQELHESARTGLASQMLVLLRRQDTVQLLASLRAIDRAAFASGSRVRFAPLKSAIPDPAGCRRGLRAITRALEQFMAAGEGDRAAIDRAIEELLTATGVPAGRGTWLEEWPAAAIDELDAALRTEYRVARREQQRARQLAQLTARVLRLLAPDERAGSTAPPPLVFARFTARGSDVDDRVLAGVSLFRPSELDHLIASDYLKLNFNKRIHWTALLAVINLIGKHPRALWRIVSGVLATADHATRSELLSRITGPDSVIGAFRQQFTVLAPLAAMVLSLEPQASVDQEPGAAEAPVPVDAYRVRLERAGREALIEEAMSIVDRRTVNEVMDRLVALMRTTGPVSPEDADAVESLGRSLGEDILQGLGIRLETEAQQTAAGGVHLQLQIPRALMKYPWELMHHRGGWLSEHFALGRQVFTSGRAAPNRARIGGPIRALVIGNPRSRNADLPYGQREAENVAAIFERLRDETDGLVDFEPKRDACIGQELTGLQLRKLLRERRYDIIHFAGHASFELSRPELSAWQLSDGPLTAQAIGTTLDWSDTEPWLVFANACEAGMDGERRRYQGDVFGLASAFLNQGVAAYIAPLWPIHDVVAADMAQVFYTALLKERQTAGEALRLARVAAKRTYYDPALGLTRNGGAAPENGGLALLSWAGMVLYGNSTATIGQRLGAPTLADR